MGEPQERGSRPDMAGSSNRDQLRSNEEIYKETCTREFGISPVEARGKLLALSEQGKGRTRNVCATRRLTWQPMWIGGGEWGLGQ